MQLLPWNCEIDCHRSSLIHEAFSENQNDSIDTHVLFSFKAIAYLLTVLLRDLPPLDSILPTASWVNPSPNAIVFAVCRACSSYKKKSSNKKVRIMALASMQKRTSTAGLHETLSTTEHMNSPVSTSYT